MSTYRECRAVPAAVLDEYGKIREQVADIWRSSDSLTQKMSQLSRLTGHTPGRKLAFVSAKPLKTLLVGGLAGTGLGYGLGYLGEQLLPNWPNKKRVRLTGAVIGALLGMAPGAEQMARNAFAGQPLTAERPLGYTAAEAQKFDLPEVPTAEISGDPPLLKASMLEGTGAWDDRFDADEFAKIVWQDPRVAQRMDPLTQAAATGLVSGAAAVQGGNRWVTPLDVARISAGMGVGYLSGALVGRVLGALMGLPEPLQDRLKTTGAFAGILTRVVPLAFGN